jgi:hypothetical protein
MTKPKAITGYSKLVAEAAEEYAEERIAKEDLHNGLYVRNGLIDSATSVLNSDVVKEVIEQIAREAYLAGIKAFEDYEYREMGYPIFDEYWTKFIRVDNE